jgi:2-phospho-L-lactate/phosphoenolpyruvate guanylyltransferase
MGTGSPVIWTVLVPVKVLALAKSRLSGFAATDREAMALAMAVDTVSAAAACPAVADVIVVTDDPAVRTEAEAAGANVVADHPRAGLNQALVAGARCAKSRWPGRGLAALTADLPALSAAQLGAALSAAAAVRQAFVTDAAGSGTTLYTARPGAPFRPLFGPRSRMRHRQAGVIELDLPGTEGLRRDVDTPADLCEAEQIGLGARTLLVLESLSSPLR